jgi:hypothetical protein
MLSLVVGGIVHNNQKEFTILKKKSIILRMKLLFCLLLIIVAPCAQSFHHLPSKLGPNIAVFRALSLKDAAQVAAQKKIRFSHPRQTMSLRMSVFDETVIASLIAKVLTSK